MMIVVAFIGLAIATGFLIYIIRNSPPDIDSPWDWDGYKRREQWNITHRRGD